MDQFTSHKGDVQLFGHGACLEDLSISCHMSRMTRYVLLVGALSILGFVLLALLHPTSPSIPASRDRALRIAIPEDVETVDPAFSHFQLSNEVNYNIYAQFFRYGYDDSAEGYRVYNSRKIEGCAVESWRISEDGKTVVLKLRREARFSKTGDPVTADDCAPRAQRTEDGPMCVTA